MKSTSTDICEERQKVKFEMRNLTIDSKQQQQSTLVTRNQREEGIVQ